MNANQNTMNTEQIISKIVTILNRGNCCFLTSVFQSILHTPKIVESLLTIARLSTEEVNAIRMFGKEYENTLTLHLIRTIFWVGNGFEYNSSDLPFYQMFYQKHPELPYGKQHDASDAMLNIFDKIEKDVKHYDWKYNYLPKVGPTFAAGIQTTIELIEDGVNKEMIEGIMKQIQSEFPREAKKIYLTILATIEMRKVFKNADPLSRSIYGFIVNEISCVECKKITREYMRAGPFTLPILERSTISGALVDYADNLHGKTYCENCNARRTHFEKKRFFRLPKVLIITIGHPDINKNINNDNKNNKFVSYTETLDLKDYLWQERLGITNRTVYDLVSVINHHGSQMGHGHYTADVKVGGNYYNFNDETCTKLPSFRKTRDARILIYQKRK